MTMLWLLKKLFPTIIWDKSPELPQVYLTFDDGPHPQFTPHILHILKELNCKATFFLTGNNAQKYRHIVKQIHDNGHAIGNHSYYHKRLLCMRRRTMTNDLEITQHIISDIIGERPTLFRPPYGLFTPSLLNISRQLCLDVVLWTRMAYDFHPLFSDAAVISRTVKRINNGAIIVLHDGHINSGRTINILPQIIQSIQDHGLILKSL